jgi:hypothetical protein
LRLLDGCWVGGHGLVLTASGAGLERTPRVPLPTFPGQDYRLKGLSGHLQLAGPMRELLRRARKLTQRRGHARQTRS